MVRDRGVEEAGVAHLAQPCERVGRWRHLLEHVLLEAADAVLHGFEEELFLVPEVVVDGALGDPGIARDAVDGRALVAEAREAIDRRGHELLPRRLGPLTPRLAATRHTERSVSSLTRLVKVIMMADRWLQPQDRRAGCAPLSPGPPRPHPGPAVDAQDLAGDPGRVIGGEEDGGAADVGRLARPAERAGLQDRVAVEADQALPHLRAHEPRRDDVHPSA